MHFTITIQLFLLLCNFNKQKHAVSVLQITLSCFGIAFYYDAVAEQKTYKGTVSSATPGFRINLSQK